MRSLIIRSKDRACQLDLLLRSIKQNAENTFDEIHVIYLASHDSYKAGYDKIHQDHLSTQINLWEQGNTTFEDWVRHALTNFCKEEVAFSTDDNVVYNKVKEIPPVNYGETFSLRLGYNTIMQNHNTGEIQPPLNYVVEKDGILEWNPEYYHPASNYGYPWSLDFHIYQTRQFANIISGFRFSRTNDMEAQLCRYRSFITRMKSFTHSCSVNWPLNCLSGYTQSDNISNEFLNQEFLNGKRLSLDNICRQRVIGAHQSFKLEWE
jgi:hypothetical protein